MATSINVNKQSVKQLLESGKNNPFVVPEYQRPYAWTDEQVEILFDDLWEFTATIGGTEREGTYFLGSIVSFENETKEQEIIDGQQRITSLFLLLRAIYTKLQETPEKTDKAKNFISQIEPALWRTDKLTGKVDYQNILITSRVVNNDGNEVLRKILETGKAETGAKDNYSKNYIKFQELYESASAENPLMIYEFIYALLNQAILLPITADSQETALTIFSTLNNRGLPLSDADIFKAKIYNHLKGEEKETFIEKWKELDERATDAQESIQQLFYYYMFYLRALENDKNSTTPGARRYYSANNFAKLMEQDLVNKLDVILNIWQVVTNKRSIEEEKWSENIEIIKILDSLNSYPNEFWKYPVVIYYLSHRKEENFEENYLLFLRKLFAQLLAKYIITPTINAVKTDILKLNVEIISSAHPKFEFNAIDYNDLENKIRNPHKSVVRMLLKLLAYNEQDELLPDKWEIEHILPQKWEDGYFPNVPDEVVKEKVEHIGNKTPFEKKLNIKASNGFFKKKKECYAESKIVITKAFAKPEITLWDLDSIAERDIRVSDSVLASLKTWNDTYDNLKEGTVSNGPSAEERAQIEEFKKKGWI